MGGVASDIAGTLTFGQCDSDGCGGDHRGRGINPIGKIANKYQGVGQPSSSDQGYADGGGGIMSQLGIGDPKELLYMIGIPIGILVGCIIFIELLFKIL